MFVDWLQILPWVVFGIIIAGILALDLGVFNRDAHEPSKREALTWAIVWVSVAIIFNLGVYISEGWSKGLEWTTGYVIELSLSVDNIFVFILIFSTFAVPGKYRHRVLFWGILGAVIMRAILIAFAGVLLDQLHFVIYIFGAFLVFTGYRFLRGGIEEAPDLESNRLVKLARRFYPVWPHYEGQAFTIVKDGVRYLTPLFLVLLLIESTDLVFAVDSIPAIYGITHDPFVVYTSNIFAILGLRSMYFVLSGYLAGLAYLKQALAAILTFVGVKMLLVDVVHVHPLISLSVIIGILTVAIFFSLRKAQETGGLETIAEAYSEAAEPDGEPDFEKMLREKHGE
ncbi:MAG: TerC family protein [Thermomicrobiales bacterium]|nr:TerC family protein [Thermomicrobiales bacterium]